VVESFAFGTVSIACGARSAISSQAAASLRAVPADCQKSIGEAEALFLTSARPTAREEQS
jgi:hypothetical protein